MASYTTLVTTATLAAHLDEPNWAVIDCRFALLDTEIGRSDYLAAHIPGAIYAHLDEDLSSPRVPGKTGRHPLPTPTAIRMRPRRSSLCQESNVSSEAINNAGIL